MILRFMFLLGWLLNTTFAWAEVIDLRQLQTPVKNQGERDLCAFYAVTGLLESAIKTQFNTELDVSEDYEWTRSKVLKRQRPEVEFGDTYLLAQNLVRDNELRTENGQQFYFSSLAFKELTQLWVKTPWSEQIMSQLKQKRSVVVTLKISPSYIDDSSGVVEFNSHINHQCSLGKITCGGHAVIITGYDSTKKVFMFKNSWGPAWGQDGYGFVSFDHVDRFSDQPLILYFDRLSYPQLKPN